MPKKVFLFLIATMLVGTILFPQKSPDEFLGVQVGADRTLVKYPDIGRYLQYLDSESKRIKVTDEGQSTLGNPIYLAFISSEENIGRLDELVAINKKLANPDTVGKDRLPALLKKAKVFVLITCTIHSTEIAASQMAMILAHKLVTGKDPVMTGYLDNVVLLLMPSINPDGNIMVTEWYEKYKGSEYEGSRAPFLYHHYAGHDTNRDFYMLNLKESRVVNGILHHRYFPQVFLDMHQMGSTGPRMFVPPFKDPLNRNLEPLLLRETDIIGTFMAWKLQEEGKKGVGSSYAFDAYWPGGTKNTAWYKNVVGILTELASARMATPIYIDPNELRAGGKGLPEYKAQVNFPDPWEGGWWRMQDIMDYEQIAAEALLEVTSKNRRSFLSNFYKLGLTNIEKGAKQAPYGYVIPQEQWDLAAAYNFLQKLAQNGVRISRLDNEARFGNRVYAKGDFVITMNQPYRNFIKTMLERQRYPEIKFTPDGPIIEPYDASGWTLPLQMGVRCEALDVPLTGLQLSPVKNPTYPEYAVSGEGNYYVIPGRFNRSAIVVNRLQKKGVTVYRYKQAGHASVNAGDFMVKDSALNTGGMIDILKTTGVQVGKTELSLSDQKNLKQLRRPRIGIYQSWRASMDEGWTRWVLDHFEFPFTVLHNKDIQDRQMARKYDVVLIPDIGRTTIVDGISRGYYAMYAHGVPPEYREGIGKKGVEALKSFVQNGGTLVLLDSASQLAIKDFGLPFRNVLEKVNRDEFYAPGALLRVFVDNTDPIGWGLEKESILYFSHSPSFKTRSPQVQSRSRKVVARFGNEGPHLLSGYLKGGKYLDRTVTTMRFGYHKGTVIVLGGRVQHRAQTFATFKFLFNSLYF